jgi:hypothetical protein
MRFTDINYLLWILRNTGADYAEIILEMAARGISINKGTPAGNHFTTTDNAIFHGKNYILILCKYFIFDCKEKTLQL